MSDQRQICHIAGMALVLLLVGGCISPSPTPELPSPTPTPASIRLHADGSGDYATLEEAVQNAPEGSTILLAPGTYRLESPLDIQRPLRLVGEGMDQTEVVCEAEGYVVRFDSEGTFAAQGITFRHEGDAVADVVVVEVGEIDISDCGFARAVSQEGEGRNAGLLIQGQTTGTIEGCTATENGTGILILDEAQVTLVQNVCSDNEVGIEFSDSSGGTARENECSWNYGGIAVGGAAQPTLEDNTCSHNGAVGIVYTGDAGGGGTARRNECSDNGGAGISVIFDAEPTLEHNVLIDNSWAGIYYTDSGSGVASQNECSGGDHGIEVGGQARPTLEGNTCTDNELSGIYYWQEAGGTARENVCSESATGIFVLDYADPLLEENICTNNSGDGIYIALTANPDLVDNDLHDNAGQDVMDERQSTTEMLPEGIMTGESPPASASLGNTWFRPTDGMVMFYVPGGEFQMGSDEGEADYARQVCEEFHDDCSPDSFAAQQPMHAVALSGFWMDQTEVTNAQYKQCVSAGSCRPPDENYMPHELFYDDRFYSDYPVITVNWFQARNYCEWAGARLPTEAEWEYAARGPEQQRYPWGDEFDGELLNYCDVNCEFDWADWTDEEFDDGNDFIAPVGEYPGGVSWCGVLDMAGNVWEWVADWLGDYPSERQEDPLGPLSGEARVLRGGCWICDRGASATTFRNWEHPNNPAINAGFRCVLSAPDSE